MVNIYKTKMNRMVRTIEILSRFKEFETLIKPHTRSEEERRFFDGMPLPCVERISSVELCQWADVILVIGSSIMLEGITQGKPVLYLKYLHER